MISINEKLGLFLLKSNFRYSKNHMAVIGKPSFIQGGVFKGVFPIR